MSNWFIPEPEDFPSQRALLHLGLNRALRYYRELVVPGIGGVWFARQLSWAVAGIALAKELNMKAAKVANGIEALAGKIEWYNSTEYYGRGIRAFNRDGNDVWSFKELSDQTHYVQIPYRQSTVRALAGLGITRGTRFNNMDLTEIGYDLSNAFLDQTKIRNYLIEWIKGEDEKITKSIIKGLTKNKENVTDTEKYIIRECLLSDSTDSLSDSNRRNYMILSFGRNTVNRPDLKILKRYLIQHKNHIIDIETAIEFDKMLESSQMFIYICAELLEENIKLPISRILDNNKVTRILNILIAVVKKYIKSIGKKHPDAIEFASIITNKDKTKIIENLIKRDGAILAYSNGKIVKGPLFSHRRIISEEDPESIDAVGSEESSTENKINQLFTLWSDCL